MHPPPCLVPTDRPRPSQALAGHSVQDERAAAALLGEDLDYFLRRPRDTPMQVLAPAATVRTVRTASPAHLSSPGLQSTRWPLLLRTSASTRGAEMARDTAAVVPAATSVGTSK